MRMRFLPDEPIISYSQDTLGLRDFVELIQTSIYNTEAPFVYGVLGDWGSGKTSTMLLLKDRFENDLQSHTHTYIPIWFHAWKYENETNVIYPLLHAIKQDYKERIGVINDAKEFGKKFTEVVATSTLALTDVMLRAATKTITGEAIALKDISDHLKAVQEHPEDLADVLGRWVDEVDNLHRSFESLIDVFSEDFATVHPEAKKDDIRFVIMIDDLDRCLPETSIAIIESIKNYLSAKNCVFVLGLNPYVVYQGIRVKYHGLEIDGREYLEKILNYSFYMPMPESTAIEQFGISNIQSLVLEKDEQDKYEQFFREFGKVLRDCQFNNPRKIKRILNRYLFFLGKYEQVLNEYDNVNTIKLIILSEYFSEIFILFMRDAKQAKEDLTKIGDADFDIVGFENKHGVVIKSIYHHLSNMKGLFQLELPISKNQPTIEQHSVAVLSITRIL